MQLAVRAGIRNAAQHVVKTELELSEFRDRLTRYRSQLKAREDLARELRGPGDLDQYGYDAGDRATQDEDKNRVARQRRARVAELAAVDSALLRLEEGTYGDCVACGEDIAIARLRAIPEAPCCAACTQTQEQEGGTAPAPAVGERDLLSTQ